MHSTLIDCLRLMLRPMITFCLRHSIGLQDLLEAAKVVFIEIAAADMQARGEKINISRLSVVTGVHRKDAVRIYREGNIDESASRFTVRVINQWRQDKRFQSSGGRPRPLTYEGDNSEFSKLVVLVSTDLHPGTVLFDLERLGAIERLNDGRIRLKAAAYVPKHNPKESFRVMAEDTEDFTAAVVENIFSETEPPPNYHAKMFLDNIAEDDVPKIRQWLFDRCSAFQQKCLEHLAKYDLDIKPKKGKKGGKRIVLGIFTRT